MPNRCARRNLRPSRRTVPVALSRIEAWQVAHPVIDPPMRHGIRHRLDVSRLVFYPVGQVLSPPILGNQPVVAMLAAVEESFVSHPLAHRLPSIRVFGGALDGFESVHS